MPLLLPLAACSPAFERDTPTTAPAMPAASRASGATSTRAPDVDKGASATLLAPGKPPHRHLRYALEPGTGRQFRIEQRFTLFDGDTELGSVELQAPLMVAVEAVTPAGHSLRIALGPIGVTREGQSDAIRWGGVQPGSRGSEGRLSAVVQLAASGVVRSARIEAAAGSEAALLFETLLSLDAPPSEPVGAGARWRTLREDRGSVQTLAEHELVQIAGQVATFRVQRRQTDGLGATTVRSIGEWSFTRDAWPPMGHDQLSASLPESGPRARFSVTFAVRAGAIERAADGAGNRP